METPPFFAAQTQPQLPPPSMRVRFDAIREAWGLIWPSDVWPWVIAMIVFMGVSYAVQIAMMPIAMATGALSGPSGSSSSPSSASALGLYIGLNALIGLIVMVLQGVICCLPQRLALRKLRGLPATVNDMFSFDGAFPKLALWWLVCPLLYFLLPALVAGIGFGSILAAGKNSDPSALFAILIPLYVIAIVAALAIQSLFAFVPLLLIDKGLGVVEAAKLSARTLSKHVLPMMGVYFCAAFVSALGICACGIGFLVTGSIVYATIGVIYNDFFRPGPTEVLAEGSYYPRPQ